MAASVASRIAHGYLSLLRVVGLLLVVVLGAAACGAAIAAPLWLFATRATTAYNWFVVVAAGAAVLATLAARVVRGARRAASAGHYLRAVSAAGARFAGRSAAVATLAAGALMVFARWGIVPGVLALPLVLVLIGLVLFGRRQRPRDLLRRVS